MSWSLDTWGNQDRLDAASQFLSTGVISTVFGGTGCSDSSQCASGFKCSGGRCVQITTPGGGPGGGAPSGPSYVPGSCDGGPDGSNPNAPAGAGQGCSSPTPIGGGPGGGGCTTSTCGQNGDGRGYGGDSDCCGERCCRYFATGSGVNVNCYCGNCPGYTGDRCGEGYAACGPGLVCQNGYCVAPKPCSTFCSEYYEANGQDAAGCSQDYRCDECTECTGDFGNGGGNYCEGKAKSSLPCHCQGAELDECDICNNDGSVSPGVCLECCSIENVDCGCGLMARASVCQPRNTNGLSVCNQAQNAARAKCAEVCGTGTPADPCAGACMAKVGQQSAGPCPDPNDPIADCPDGVDCRWTGCIEAGGQHTLLYNECDMSNVPPECKACDCNCHNDCPTCQLCGADGKCYVDPTCEETQDPVSVTVTTITTQFYETYYCDASPCYGQIIGSGVVDVNTSTTEISYNNFINATASGPEPNRPCDDYVRYNSANGPGGKGGWYESGFRGFGGPVVINHCPGSAYKCPACNGNRRSTWFVYQTSYSFNY